MSVLTETANTPAAWTARAETAPSPWEACGWSEQSQRARLDKVVEALNPRPGETLLDWGCGTGELASRLAAEIRYVGFDWSEGMVTRASRSHPGRAFQTWEPRGRFDLVACVGALNLPGGWSKEMTWATLRRLWDNCGRAMAVSLYAGSDTSCLIYTDAECKTFACGESFYRRVERWRPNDILVVLERGRRALGVT